MTASEESDHKIIEGFNDAMLRLRKAQPGSEDHNRILAELQMKQGLMQFVATKYQMRASEAEEKAAEATMRGADAAAKNARYMLSSGFAAAFSAIVALLSTIASLWSLYNPPQGAP